MDLTSVRFERSEEHRVVVGVAAGFGRRHGVDPMVVRAALVVLSFAAGIGVVLYAGGAALSVPEGALGVDGADVPHPHDVRRDIAVALVSAGLLLMVRATPLWLSDAVMLPLVVFVVGVALVFGGWVGRLTQAANEERRQRIRAEEREAMAAHLHDSVLQTLALIQRTADDPRRTASLARQQEHELRAWLFGLDEQSSDSLAVAVRAMARDVEQRHEVRVDVVVVGDAPIDDSITALVSAMREACVNAAKHSGVDDVAIYVEAMPATVDAWVRDRGRGFDVDAPHDGHGIAQSIEARVERVGGTAHIASSKGNGTEVHLSVPRNDRAATEATR
jgi:signal transduction histidine kinase/phage shock protein PspC (stress-responsive transcriptional regulator)